MRIAILGGTGNEGFGLGQRWAASGHEIIIGSRLAKKGAGAAVDMKSSLPQATISGTDNLSAAKKGDLVVLSVPYAAQEITLDAVKSALAGKILLTVVAPLNEKKKARARRMPDGLSAAEEAQRQVGRDVQVVAAFQNISFLHLSDREHSPAPDCDVLVCGDSTDAKHVVLGLCRDAGMSGVNVGALQNSGVVEGITALLIAVNIIHKVKDAGVRITGLPNST